MKDTFDFLTTYGKSRKVYCFLPAISYPKVAFDTTNTRPWAASKRTSAIGAYFIGDDGAGKAPPTTAAILANALEIRSSGKS